MSSFRLTATGDSLVSQDPLTGTDPALLDVIRAGDARFTNLEGVVRALGEGTPAGESGGTWVGISPAHTARLAEMGFNMFSTAHNHALDWGQDGLLAQTRHLDALGVCHAGAGANLGAARAPRYLDTGSGRVALVAASTSFHNWNRAGAVRQDCGGRPGLSGIRVRSRLEVTEEDFALLESLSADLQLNSADDLRVKLGFRKPLADGEMLFLGRSVRRADQRRLHEELDPRDVAGVLASISEAARQSERVIFSIHSHQHGDGRLDTPPGWLRDLARQALEAGADAVIGHGPHILRGIEIMNGKPVLYSLGNFIFQNETQPVQPADQFELQGLPESASVADVFDERSRGGGFAAHRHYWETVVADMEWQGRDLTALRLHPVTLGFGEQRSRRGQPRIAAEDEARAIIRGLAELSAELGTEVVWDENGWGTVRL